MSSLDLHILPVYSLYHPTASINGMRLLQHQMETLEAFHNADIDVVINVAMTGDGKSVAGYLPTFQPRGDSDTHVIAMYPTNELIKDQYYAIEGYQRKLKLKLPRYETMYSDQITRLMRDHDEDKRSEEVRKLLKRHGILLTNPDLVHLIRSYQYGWGFQRKELSQILASHFDYMLFDEFHVFGVPQIVSVVNMLGFLATQYNDSERERKKFVFLSATPNPLLMSLLERSGLRHKVINGHYVDMEDKHYRRILQPCEISLHAVSQEQTSEMWIEEHLEELLRFFKRYPSSRAAILVYSPATARRLVQRLEAFFAPHDITVGENTGLTSEEDRREALQKQILVGTSTVDVGIDFHINYLIFEGYSAGSFLQRFGRLGRHEEFEAYCAYALVPRFVLERLTADMGNEQEVSRERFNKAIREAFPTEQEFKPYTKIWGPVQAVHVLKELEAQQGKGNLDENRAFRQALTTHYDNMYRSSDEPEQSAMEKASKKYWKLKNTYPEVMKELLSFRGQSVLDCGVWDMSDLEKHPDGTFITYDLFFLVANTNFEVIEEDNFLEEARRRSLEVRDFQKKFLYLKVHSYVQERSSVQIGINKSLISADANDQYLHRLLVLSGLVVQEPRAEWIDRVNDALRKQRLTCIISSIKRQDIKQKLQLSGVFPVYRLQDKLGSEYAIAFGQDAILLDSILRFRSSGGSSYLMA
jgi:CRISPR-associated endonuclease/helicase Cas3